MNRKKLKGILASVGVALVIALIYWGMSALSSGDGANGDATRTPALARTAAGAADMSAQPQSTTNDGEAEIAEDGIYTSKDMVAQYIHTYDKLPSNYITKEEAVKLGWDSGKGNLAEVAPGKSIGGSVFGNYEGKLPDKDGRKWYECDIDYESGFRGAQRLVYSNDGLIYYTADHYETFEALWE